jgi:hypothetical protein
MAFAVSDVQKIRDDVWVAFFGQWTGNGVPWSSIQNWNTDAINYTHAQKLDMFGAGTGTSSAPGGAAAWVA